MQKSLYCYFGLLTQNTLDIPGHQFYQLPLMDATADYLKLKKKKYDVFSYIPADLVEKQLASGVPMVTPYGPDKVGLMLETLATDIIDTYLIERNQMIDNIRENLYEKIILKARFRNLSTLTKKWDDATIFESIIRIAINAEYDPSDIVILDTDMSLPENFRKWCKEQRIKIVIPSIDYCPISPRVANALIGIWSDPEFFKLWKQNRVIYYGNLSASSGSVYKAGHSKNSIIYNCLSAIHNLDHFGSGYHLTLAGKCEVAISDPRTITFSRTDRNCIQTEFLGSKICLNVTKDLYSDAGFVPARVYEAMIFGAIPVSYNMPFIHPAMSFNDVDEFTEILKYIIELTDADYLTLYKKMMESILAVNLTHSNK